MGRSLRLVGDVQLENLQLVGCFAVKGVAKLLHAPAGSDNAVAGRQCCLIALWKVAQHGDFTAAAADLAVSPSALSQAIRRLEKRLGVRLLNRTTRGVSLTEAGQGYLALCWTAFFEITFVSYLN